MQTRQLLYKKHFVGKHTYGQYGQGEALSRTRSPKNSHSYMLNITSTNMNFVQEPTNNNEQNISLQIHTNISVHSTTNKWKIHCKKHREIKEHKKKEIILLTLVLIFLTIHSSHNYSVCHKLLNMQNIYMLPSIVIWKLLITYHVSSLNITTVFPLTSPILIPFSCHRKDSGTWN